MNSHNNFLLAGFLSSTTEILQWLLEKQPIGFLPASGMLWHVLAALMPMHEASLAPDAAATVPTPHAAGLPLILCGLAPLNQQFLAVLTTDRPPAHWPAVYKRNIPGYITALLLWQEVAFRIAETLIDGQREAAQAAAGIVGGYGQGAAAGGDGGRVGARDMEQLQQHGQGLPAVSSEGIISRAVTQLAASPALWASAWAQLGAFCQGMYTWQGGKLAEAQPSSSSTDGNSSCSSSSKSSRSSTIAGSSGLAGMFASLQLSPDHEQVTALFHPREISARIEALNLPAKGRPFSETALASNVRRGFVAPAAFLCSVVAFHGQSFLCGGPSFQQGASGDMGPGSCGREYSGRGGNSGGGGNSSGAGRNSASGPGGGSSDGKTGAGESISMEFSGNSCGRTSSCSSGHSWSSSIGGVAPAAAPQVLLEAAALVGVADMRQESTAAVLLLCSMANWCSIGSRKCLLSTRGGLVLDVLTAAARFHPESFSDTANLMYIFVAGAAEGGWGWGGTSNLRKPPSNVCASSALHGRLFLTVSCLAIQQCPRDSIRFLISYSPF